MKTPYLLDRLYLLGKPAESVLPPAASSYLLDGLYLMGRPEGLSPDPTAAYADFDGSTHRVDIPASADFDIQDVSASPFTIGGWINIDGIDGLGSAIFTIGSADFNSFAMYIHTTLNPRLVADTSGTATWEIIFEATTGVTIGQWAHVMLRRDASGVYTWFIGGSPAGQTTNAVDLSVNNFGVRLGKHYANNNYDFNGKIADWRVYDTNLSDADIATLANKGSIGTSPTVEWRFDTTLGTTLIDYAGSNQGTLVGNPATVWSAYAEPSSWGDFDGVDDYVDILDSVAGGHDFTSLSDAITISAWVKPDTVTGSATAWRPESIITELRNEGTNGTHAPFAFGLSPSSVRLGVTDAYTSGDEIVSSSESFAMGQWNHVAVTIDGDAYTFYIDGLESGSGTFSAATGDRSVGASTANMQIGVYATDVGEKTGNPFDGGLTDLQIHDSVLTAGNLLYLATDGKAGTDPGDTNLIDRWQFNDGSGLIIAGDNGNDGTLVGDDPDGANFHNPYTG